MEEKSVPVVTPETKPFWDGCAEGVLKAQWCSQCLEYVFYPRSACPLCGSVDSLQWKELSGNANLHSYVISHLQAPGFDPPYIIAVVQLQEGPRMLTNIVSTPAEPDSLSIDMPVRVEFERRGAASVPVFKPAERRQV